MATALPDGEVSSTSKKKSQTDEKTDPTEDYLDVSSEIIPEFDWADDDSVANCRTCSVKFTWKKRRHHCRICGDIFCEECSPPQAMSRFELVRVCDSCIKKTMAKKAQEIRDNAAQKKKLKAIRKDQQVSAVKVTTSDENISQHQNMQQMKHKQMMMQRAIAVESKEIKEVEKDFDPKTKKVIEDNVNLFMKDWREFEYAVPQINRLKWVPDEEGKECLKCNAEFTDSIRRHHCRVCGRIYCDNCSPFVGLACGISMSQSHRGVDSSDQFRMCEECVRAEVTTREGDKQKAKDKAKKIEAETERRRDEWQKAQDERDEKQKSNWTNLQ